jgi:hypothetical protein
MLLIVAPLLFASIGWPDQLSGRLQRLSDGVGCHLQMGRDCGLRHPRSLHVDGDS